MLTCSSNSVPKTKPFFLIPLHHLLFSCSFPLLFFFFPFFCSFRYSFFLSCSFLSFYFSCSFSLLFFFLLSETEVMYNDRTFQRQKYYLMLTTLPIKVINQVWQFYHFYVIGHLHFDCQGRKLVREIADGFHAYQFQQQRIKDKFSFLSHSLKKKKKRKKKTQLNLTFT